MTDVRLGPLSRHHRSFLQLADLSLSAGPATVLALASETRALDHAPDRTGRIRLVAPTLRARTARVASSLATVAFAGWLSSGSCTVAACYEDCDPCFQACKCSNVCQHPVLAGSGLDIVEHTSRIVESSRGRFVREIQVVVGPTLEFAEEQDSMRVADFARRVLDANADLFTSERAPKWALVGIHAFRDSIAVAFELEPPTPRGSNSVTLSFDAHGRLLEVAHVVDRTTS